MTVASDPDAGILVSFTLNGKQARVRTGVTTTLLTALRDDLNVNSARHGCDHGACGVCTVLLDGEPRRACLLTAFMAEGRQIITIEGVAEPGTLHPLQRAFHEKFASQCGFCTPGMILTASALLQRTASPSREEIVSAISGNLCRCTGYQAIIQAIESVAGAGG